MLVNPLCWLVTFIAALVALYYSVHLEFHNYRHRIFGIKVDSNRRIVAFGILALGAFCLFAPITWVQCFSTDAGEGWTPTGLNILSWIITNMFTVGWTTTIQTGLTDVTSTVFSAIQTGSGLVDQILDLAYALLTLAYIIALPAEIGLFAFNAVTTRLAGYTIKRHLKHADRAIIFDGINANTELLVRDIVLNIKNDSLDKSSGNDDVSLIFCMGEDEDGDRKQTLRNLCQGYARYVFSGDDVADVLVDVTTQASRINRLANIDVIAACEQTEHNVSATIEMLEALHDAPSYDSKSLKITLHCIHDNPDDAQIFDAIKIENEPTCLHLVSRTQDEVYDVLEKAPLFGALDRIDLSVDCEPRPQNLTVLVVGAGAYGMQAARTAYWMGRMPSIKLNIVVADPDAHTILEREASRYPEMLGEVKDGVPTVRFVEASAPSLAFDRLMAGECLSALHYDNQNKCVAADGETILLPDDARIYAFVTTGDSSQNLSCSLMLQRQIFNRYVEHGRPDYIKHQPVICPHIESEEILNALQRLDKATVSIMHPFGSHKTFYTYRNIIDDKREREAIQLNAAYELCFNGAIKNDFNATLPISEARESYNHKETNKSSSRASAAHIPYRFWTLGFSADAVAGSSFGQDWIAKLQDDHGATTVQNANIVSEVLSSVVPDEASKREFDANEKKNREQFDIICRLGDMEHARWLAYCQATGMTELGHGNAGLEHEQRMRVANVDALLSGKPASSKPEEARKSDALLRHAYMTPDNEILGDRGFLLGKDVFAYDRAIVALSARIAKSDIAK